MSEIVKNYIEIDGKERKSLKKEIEGDVLGPDDWGYEKASAVWDSTGFKQHPALTIVPKTATDVEVAVSFARKWNLPIATQSGGHGHPHPANGAMFINFKKMTGIELDPEISTVRFEPGVIFKELVKETQKHDLAPLTGFSATIGVTGFMLEGGVGWLTRRFGAATGSIRAAELVTVEGVKKRVTASSDPELFWGLRGAGANFGVVTALECALYPVKEVYGGHVVYPAENIKDVLEAYAAFTMNVPDELMTALRIVPFPPGKSVPGPVEGKIAIVIMACFSGDPAQGEKLLAPLRSLAKPLRDSFKKMPYSHFAKISDDPPVPPPFYLYSDGGSLTSLTLPKLQILRLILLPVLP